MHLSVYACFICLLVCLHGWSPLIIRFIIGSNAVLNYELSQASPHQMFYIALQIIRDDHPGKQTSKQKQTDISSVWGFAPIMNNYLAKLMVGPRPPQALPQLRHWDHAPPTVGRYNIVLCCDTLSCRTDCPTN